MMGLLLNQQFFHGARGVYKTLTLNTSSFFCFHLVQAMGCSELSSLKIVETSLGPYPSHPIVCDVFPALSLGQSPLPSLPFVLTGPFLVQISWAVVRDFLLISVASAFPHDHHSCIFTDRAPPREQLFLCYLLLSETFQNGLMEL